MSNVSDELKQTLINEMPKKGDKTKIIIGERIYEMKYLYPKDWVIFIKDKKEIFDIEEIKE